MTTLNYDIGNSMKLISIVILIYNTERFLKRCFDSIIVQDYTKFEVILINDGSTDNSLEICEKYAAKDIRFHVVSKENAGVGEARNTGLSLAKGEYLMFIDSDDFILPNMLSTMVSVIERADADICVCQMAYGDDSGTDYRIIQPNNIPLGAMNSIEFERIMTDRTSGYYDGIVCSPWNKLYKKELFEGLFFSGGIGEDYEINDYINSFNRTIIIIPDTFYVYCNNPLSATRKPFNESRLLLLTAPFVQK